jgi:hypothetical protein
MTGALRAVAEACLDRDSRTFGSVVERGNAGGDVIGGVPLREDRRNPTLMTSVVRCDEGGGKGVTAGVETD